MGAREVQRRRGSGEAPLLGRGCGKEDTRGLKPRNNAAELVARHVAGALLKVRRQHDKNPQLTPPPKAARRRADDAGLHCRKRPQSRSQGVRVRADVLQFVTLERYGDATSLRGDEEGFTM